jgi:ArsR family transcriptional regulator
VVGLDKVAEALGDPLRVRILDLLAAGRHPPCCSPANPDSPVAICACDIAEDLGGLAASNLAYHLGRLRAAGLVNEQKRGKWVYYSINQDALNALCQGIAERWVRRRPSEPASCCRPTAKAARTARR